MRRIRAFAVLFVLCWMLLPGTAQASDPPSWGEPVQLGTDLPSSWFSDIDVDPNGRFRLVWSASLIEGDANKDEGQNGAVMVTELKDGDWSQPADIFVMQGGIASRPLIASDGAWVHMIFRTAPVGVPVRLVYSRAPVGGDLSNTHTWSDPVPLTNGESYWAQLRTLPDGDLVVLYSQVTTTSSTKLADRRTALYERRSTDAGVTWSQPIRVSYGTESIARCSVAVSPDGRVLLASWDYGYETMAAIGEPLGIGTSFSLDGGLTWSEPQEIAGGYEQSVVATTGDRALLVYRSTTEDLLYYQSSGDGGQTWSEPTRIPGGAARPYTGKHNFEKLSMAIDGDGRFLLSWVGTNPSAPKGLSVFVSTWADDEWTRPFVVASPDGFPEYPRIAVGSGNQLELAYFVRDTVFDVGEYTMWVVSGTSDAQAIAPANIAPAQVTPSPVRVVPTPELFGWPTPEAVPTPDPGALVINRTPQDISSQPVRELAAVTLAGLLIVLVTIAAVRRLIRM